MGFYITFGIVMIFFGRGMLRNVKTTSLCHNLTRQLFITSCIQSVDVERQTFFDCLLIITTAY